MKILFLAANPTTTNRLALDEEIRAVKGVLESVKYRSKVDLEVGEAVRPSDLVKLVRSEEPTVVHFSGHGTPEGIMLQGDAGVARVVSNAALKTFFDGRNVELVVFNSCYSMNQAQGVGDVVPTVVGTTAAVMDRAAREFSVAFYRRLGDGGTIAEAFKDGCDTVALNDMPDVFHRAGALERALCSPRKKSPTVPKPAGLADVDRIPIPADCGLHEIAKLLVKTIEIGAPIYNAGSPAGCLQVYERMRKRILDAVATRRKLDLAAAAATRPRSSMPTPGGGLGPMDIPRNVEPPATTAPRPVERSQSPPLGTAVAIAELTGATEHDFTDPDIQSWFLRFAFDRIIAFYRVAQLVELNARRPGRDATLDIVTGTLERVRAIYHEDHQNAFRDRRIETTAAVLLHVAGALLDRKDVDDVLVSAYGAVPKYLTSYVRVFDTAPPAATGDPAAWQVAWNLRHLLETIARPVA
jgi:hypothetical protein